MSDNHMTEYSMETLTCPQCGKEHTLRKYKMINVTQKPGMKDDILKNKVFGFSCDQCGLKAPLTYPCIYWDSKKKFVMALDPTGELEGNDAMELPATDKGWTRRTVDNINSFKEKIMILDNMLDDRIIEMIKIDMLAELKEEMKDDTLMDILFDYKGNDLFMIVFFEKKGMGRIPLNIDAYRSADARYGQRVRAHTTREWMNVDMKWAGDIQFSK